MPVKQEACLTWENIESLPDMLTYSFHVVLWPIKKNKAEWLVALEGVERPS